MGTKRSVFLYDKENPGGVMMNLGERELKEHLDNGWLDSPASLNVKTDDAGVTVEDAKNASPGDLVKLVESLGFIVMTPEQLKAEAVKMASVALDIEKFDDSAIIAEAERRGLKQSTESANKLNALQDKFNDDPKSLNIDELVALGNNGYSLGLRSNMKEDTLIAKIQSVLTLENE